MHGWGWWQVVRVGFVVVVLCASPILDVRVVRRLKRHPTAAGRLWFYRTCIAMNVLLAAVSVVLMSGGGVWRLAPGVLARAGFVSHAGPRLAMEAWSAGFCAVALTPGVLCLVSRKRQGAYTQYLAKDALGYLFPVGVSQRRWWALVSVTAGVCEELIFRGLYLQVATGELRMGLLWALFATSAAFGVGHLYQGAANVVKTGMVGLVLGCVAVLTGGLVVPMVVHAVIDLQILLMYRRDVEAVGV